MIISKIQYQLAKDWLPKFQDELDEIESLEMSELRKRIHRDAIQSQIDELTTDIKAYEEANPGETN